MGNIKPNFGKGLKRARKRAGYKRQEDFADAYHVSIETVRNWEQGKTKPRFDEFLALCDFFDCDADYLIDNLDERTHDIDFICKFTGLNSKSVELLHYFSESEIGEEKRTLSFLNMVLSDPDNAPHDDEFYYVETLFSKIDQYVTARDVKRSLPPEQWILNTIEDYQTLQRSRAFEEKIIELIPSKNLTEIVNITDLYTTFKWNQIKVLVDKYRNAEQKKKENNDKPSKTKKYRSAAPKDGTAAQQEDEEKDR